MGRCAPHPQAAGRARAAPTRSRATRRSSAFLENELGTEALRAPAIAAARRGTSQSAIDLDPDDDAGVSEPRRRPARTQGDRAGADARVGTADRRGRPSAPTWPSIASSGCTSSQGTPQRFVELCRRLIAANPQDWRARLALAGTSPTREQPREALELLLERSTTTRTASPCTRRSGTCCCSSDLERALVQRYIELDARARCSTSIRTSACKCHYRSTELLWQCPHCHEWNTFVEERIAPAKETVGDVAAYRRRLGGRQVRPIAACAISASTCASVCSKRAVGLDDVVGRLTFSSIGNCAASRRSASSPRSACRAPSRAQSASRGGQADDDDRIERPCRGRSRRAAGCRRRQTASLAAAPRRTRSMAALDGGMDDALRGRGGRACPEHDLAERRTRSMVPSRPHGVGAEALRDRGQPGVPGATTSRASTSASTTGTPASRSRLAT